MQKDPSPTCNFQASQTGKDVVFSYTLTVASDVDITATSAGNAPVIYVRKPGQCTSTSAANELGCNDSFGAAPTRLTLYGQQPGTYFLWVDSDFQSSGPFSLSVQLTPSQPSPMNDSCATPQLLTFNATNLATATGDTSGANNSNAPNDPSPSCSVGARQSGLDVAYQFTTAALQDVVISVARSGTMSTLAPVIYLRPQTQCASGAVVKQLCATGATFVNNRLLRLPAGTYVLWVDSNSQAQRGAFDLSVQLEPPTMAPVNETCSTATTLTPFDPTTSPVISLTATNEVATNDNSAGPPQCSAGARTSGRDVYYAYTLPAGTHQVSFAAAALGVDSTTATGGSFALTGRIGAPPNDTCATARTLLLSTATADNAIIDTTRLSTADYTSPAYGPSCSQYTEAGKDLVYAFTYTGTVAKSVTATVTPDGDFDVGLLRLEGICAPSACVALDDSGASGQEETLTWVAQPNTTYWLVVDGWVANEEGAFRLRVE